MKLEIKYLIGLALGILLIVSGWYARSVYDDHLELQLIQIRGAVALATAEEIAKIKIENKTVYNKTLEKISTEVQYKECVADQQMLLLTNQVIMGAAWK